MASTWWLERSLVRPICSVRVVYISDAFGRAFLGMFLWVQSISMSSCLCFLFSSSRRLCFSWSSCTMDLLFSIGGSLSPTALKLWSKKPSSTSVGVVWVSSCLEDFAGASLTAVSLFLLEVSRFPWSPLLLRIPRRLYGSTLLSFSDFWGFLAISIVSLRDLICKPFNVKI